MFATVQFAGLAVGSIVWGQAAQMIGLPAVHISRRSRCRLGPTGAALEGFRPPPSRSRASMHWPAPFALIRHRARPSPVLVTIEYVVAAVDRAAFLTAMAKLAGESAGETALLIGDYEDASKEVSSSRRFTSILGSAHAAAISASPCDRILQDVVHRFDAEGDPAVRHLIAAKRNERS